VITTSPTAQPVTNSCSVLIVEDDARFRETFAHAISLAPDLTLVGSAADYASGLEQLARRPDVLLVDLQLPDGNGIDLIREAARQLPMSDALVVTVFGDERHVLESIEAGATGYLLKDTPPTELAEHVRVLRAGGSPISPAIARRLLARLGAAPTRPTVVEPETNARLSEQEIKVLTLSAKGFSYDEIASLMQVSRHTVQTYVKRSYRKLQVHSKVEALSEARRLNLLNE
jgi:DNA-binding NarL/FixJ family response regulator